MNVLEELLHEQLDRGTISNKTHTALLKALHSDQGTDKTDFTGTPIVTPESSPSVVEEIMPTSPTIAEEDPWEFTSNLKAMKKSKKKPTKKGLGFDESDLSAALESANLAEPAITLQDAQLFLQCARCMRADYITFAKSYIPNMLVMGQGKCTAALLMNTCTTCLPPQQKDGWGDLGSAERKGDAPATIPIHKDFMLSSPLYKAAKSIAGTDVYIVAGQNNELACSNMNMVSRQLTPADKMASLDLNRVGEDLTLVKLPYLSPGLF